MYSSYLIVDFPVNFGIRPFFFEENLDVSIESDCELQAIEKKNHVLVFDK